MAIKINSAWQIWRLSWDIANLTPPHIKNLLVANVGHVEDVLLPLGAPLIGVLQQ